LTRSTAPAPKSVTKVDQFRNPQPMPKGDKDHRGIPVAATVALRRCHEALYFGLGQILAGA